MGVWWLFGQMRSMIVCEYCSMRCMISIYYAAPSNIYSMIYRIMSKW